MCKNRVHLIHFYVAVPGPAFTNAGLRVLLPTSLVEKKLKSWRVKSVFTPTSCPDAILVSVSELSTTTHVTNTSAAFADFNAYASGTWTSIIPIAAGIGLTPPFESAWNDINTNGTFPNSITIKASWGNYSTFLAGAPASANGNAIITLEFMEADPPKRPNPGFFGAEPEPKRFAFNPIPNYTQNPNPPCPEPLCGFPKHSM